MNFITNRLYIIFLLVVVIFQKTEIFAKPFYENARIRLEKSRPIMTQDLALSISCNINTGNIGDVATYTLLLINQNKNLVTGLEIMVSLPVGMSLQDSSIVSNGSFANSIWVIPSFSNDTAVLTFKGTINTEGPHYVIAEIKNMNEPDIDSNPNNQNYLEDDIAIVAVSVPYHYCEGQKIEIKATAYTGLSTYQWYKNGIIMTEQNNQTLTITEAGNYTFKGTIGERMCPTELSCPIIITQNSKPYIVDTIINICAGNSLDLTAEIVDYMLYKSHSWRLNAANGSVLNTPKAVIPSNTTTYFLIAENKFGCTDTTQIKVKVNPLPSINISGSTNISAGQSTILTALENNIYVWNTGDNKSSITVSPVSTTSYFVTATDTNNCQNSSSITVKVNSPPIANSDQSTTTKDTPVEIVVINNDIDNDGAINPGSVTIVQSPKNGIATVNENGTIIFKPDEDFIGNDTIIYQVCDNGIPTLCDTAIVIITVSSTKVPPIAVNDTVTTKMNESILIDVVINDTILKDSSTLGITIIEQPNHGDVSVKLVEGIKYTPNQDWCFMMPDLFSYEICQNNLCDTAWVFVNVICNNAVVNNGISPNGDGMNDVFVIEGIENYPENRLLIFNRWGNNVANIQNYKNNWDGKWNGVYLPAGTYFYIFYPTSGQYISGYIQLNY